MTVSQKIPIQRADDHELLGFVVKDGTGWQAQTMFGFTIERTETKVAAEALLRERGLAYLLGVWQYFDTDEQDWFPCVLKEVQETRVIVLRTNAMGYQDPDDYKTVIITKPSETRLAKMS